MRQDDIVYCEMCGRPVRRKDAHIVYIDGAKLLLCPQCYSKVVKRNVGKEIKEIKSRPSTLRSPSRPRPKPRRERLEGLEVVEDFAERIRQARERLGWTQRVLAESIGESEKVIKRIEAGRLTPTIELARKLEGVLNIKLLEPVIDDDLSNPLNVGGRLRKDLTLGDIVSIRRRKKM